MGQKGFPSNMFHEIIFQTSSQYDKEMQSYSPCSVGYRTGVLMVVRVNEL